jgi:hypothetical protein
LVDRAELDTALSTISRRGKLSSAASQDLERLCAEPFDPWVGIACTIQASAFAGDGKADAARIRLQKTLRTWVDAQTAGAAAASSYTSPRVDRIQFMNTERTIARVVVTTGRYSTGGHLAVVEKVNGEWKPTRIVTVWEY